MLLGLHAFGLPEPVQLGAAAVACSALRFYALVKNVNLSKAQRLPEAPWEWRLSPTTPTYAGHQSCRTQKTPAEGTLASGLDHAFISRLHNLAPFRRR